MDVQRRVRLQYEKYPYPGTNYARAIGAGELYVYGAELPFYLRDQQLLGGRQLRILDAGCGTGLGLVSLALANKGALVVGVEPSSNSAAMARKFTLHHNVHAEVAELDITRVRELDMCFDFINCSDVLYLLDSQHDALVALKEVLAPDGIMRCNFHSYHQRYWAYRTQELLSALGIDHEGITELALQRARSAIRAMSGKSPLKRALLGGSGLRSSNSRIINNWMLQGDRGVTIDGAVGALEGAGLRFLSMVNRRGWQWRAVFDENAVDVWLREALESMTSIQELRICELVHAPGRLLDMWCDRGVVPISARVEDDCDGPNIVLNVHSLFRTDSVRAELARALAEARTIQLSRYVPWAGASELLLPEDCCMLLMLGEAPLSLEATTMRWNEWTSLRSRRLGLGDENGKDSAKAVVRRLHGAGAVFAARQGA